MRSGKGWILASHLPVNQAHCLHLSFPWLTLPFLQVLNHCFKPWLSISTTPPKPCILKAINIPLQHTWLSFSSMRLVMHDSEKKTWCGKLTKSMLRSLSILQRISVLHQFVFLSSTACVSIACFYLIHTKISSAWVSNNKRQWTNLFLSFWTLPTPSLDPRPSQGKGNGKTALQNC